MKLIAIFLLCAMLSAGATGLGQTVTLKLKDAPLSKVFKELNKQTGYEFFYNADLLDKAERVSLNVKDLPLSEVLKICFNGQPLDYKVENNTIVVKQKAVIREGELSAEEQKTVIDVSGKVTDTDGNPLVGATVAVKGTAIATKTDASGVYMLKGIDENATFEVSYAEHESLIIQVKGRSSVMMSLKKNVSPLDEVQVIAYGTRSKRFETGNVTTIKSEDIEKQPVNNVLLAIADRVPGLFITQATGMSGSGVKVSIQGRNSINNGSDPFYVIDGVPYSAELLPNYGSMLGTSGSALGQRPNGNPLSFLNPADIESISVLKDADATAIYGSRAANGAILITTKKGKAGETKVDINLQNGWGRVTRKLDLLNTQQYLLMRLEAKRNDNASVGFTDYDINGFWDVGRNTDWQKELIGNTAHYTDAQINVSGGNSSTQVLAGIGYHRETTVFPGDLSDQKASLHFSITNVSKNQKFRMQLTGNYLEDNNRIISTDLTQYAISLSPNAPELYNGDGTLNWMPDANGISTWNNPLSHLKNKYKNKTKNLVGNATVLYQLIPGLEIKGSFGYTSLQANDVRIATMLSYKPENRSNLNNRYAFYSNNSIGSWIIEPQISYKRKFRNGRLEGLMGSTIQQNSSNGLSIRGVGYNSDVVLEDIKSASSITIDGTISSVYKYNAIFGRISYNLKDRYLVNLTSRRDGSSRFGSRSQFNNFWAVGAGWIFSNERFVQEELPYISFGKITASYGTTGNDQIQDYKFMSLYYSLSSGVPYQGINGISPGGLPNAFLQWEETKKFQIGLDFGLFKDRIILVTHYFRNRSANQLLEYSLPIQTGFNTVSKNLPATIQNSGWEFTMATNNIKIKNFSWTTDFNLTIPKNKLLEFPGIANTGYVNSFTVGQPLNRVQVYRFAGVDPSTGVYNFFDSKGNLTSSPNGSFDRIFVSTAPVFFGGLQNHVRYKNLVLDVSFHFVKRNGPNTRFGNPSGAYAYFTSNNNFNQPSTILNRWQKAGDITNVQRYNSDFSLFTPTNSVLQSDAAYGDASFARLKNLSLSWALPELWCNRIKSKNARIYINAQNLITITNYIGLDPETLSSTTLPPLRVITVGIQIAL